MFFNLLASVAATIGGSWLLWRVYHSMRNKLDTRRDRASGHSGTDVGSVGHGPSASSDSCSSHGGGGEY